MEGEGPASSVVAGTAPAQNQSVSDELVVDAALGDAQQGATPGDASSASAAPPSSENAAAPNPKRARLGGKSEAEILTGGSANKPVPECIVLQSAPSDMIAIFRQLARAPCDSQREDDDSKRSLHEALRLRHEYANHPDGWVARRKRSSREVVTKWGVTDSGAMRSRVGANYQVSELPDCVGTKHYIPREQEFSRTVYDGSVDFSETSRESYLSSLDAHYKEYVLTRRDAGVSYRDIGTFREFALNTLHTNKLDTLRAAEAVKAAMASQDAFEGEIPYEVWTPSIARQYRAGADKYAKDFHSIMTKHCSSKPVKSLISYYYRSKHVDNACRRGPILLMGNIDHVQGTRMDTWQASDGDEPVVSDVESNPYNWLQVKCQCRRWLRVLERFRYLFQVCPDCERVLCLCPACSTPMVLPKDTTGQSPPAMACSNCSHVL